MDLGNGESSDDLGVVQIAPGVGILSVLGHLNYRPWYALAEYVDNALQSVTKDHDRILTIDPQFRLRVDVSYESAGSGRIVVADNAGGIHRSEFARAFRAAEVPPDTSGLSEFGMGMKSASIWFAKNWKVTTTSIGDPKEYTVEFNMDTVLSHSVTELQVGERNVEPDHHYTRIELWDLNQFLRGRTLGKVRDHLREIYRDFIRTRRIELWVAGQLLEYQEPPVLTARDYRSTSDPSRADAEPLLWWKKVDFAFGNNAKASGWAGIRAAGNTMGNGFSLFRRGRVILGTSESPYRPTSIFGQSNSYRSQRVFGELEVTGLPVSHTKDGFQWGGHEEDFEDELKKILDADPLPLLRQADNYRARLASKAEENRIRDAASNASDASAAAIDDELRATADSTTDDSVQEIDSARAGVSTTPSPEGVVAAHGGQESNCGTEPSKESISEFRKDYVVRHGRNEWYVSISVAQRPEDERWLVRHVDLDASSGRLSADVTINSGHEFVRAFAVGSRDALEAVFRLASAIVVSEALMVSAGEQEFGAQYVRNINRLLSGRLGQRSIEE